jgi:hypothetical protein
MEENILKTLRSQADEAWDKHFDTCSNAGVWKKMDATLTDIKVFESSWKIRWIETKLKELIK